MWIEVHHDPKSWTEELCWLVQKYKGKSIRADILKLALAETVYGVWKYRNFASFGRDIDITKI